MEVLQSRTDSFKAKRVPNPAKPSSRISVKWPHPRRFIASPAVLAEAGFYFNPSYEDRDSVTCFYCEKQLSHWEAEDDPFDIHWEKCKNTCCWAIVRCGLRGDMDSQKRFISADKSRLPTSKNMEQARFGTFQAGNGWIHDQAKDHGANSRKMARAGFIYTPQYEGDDLATCLYCEVSLGGWDAEDDPMEEHKKRGSKSGQQCAFLATLELIASGTKPASRSVSQSKPPPKTQSKSKYKDMVLPTKTHDGELEDDSEDTVPTAASSVKRSTRGRSTSSSTRSASGSTRSTKGTTTFGKAPKKHTRSRSRGGLKDVNENSEDMEEETEVKAPPPSRTRKTTTSKTSRSRSKSISRSVPGAFTEDDEEVDDVMIEESVVKGKMKAMGEVCMEADGEVEEVKTLKKSTRGRPKAKVENDRVEEATTLKKSTRSQPLKATLFRDIPQKDKTVTDEVKNKKVEKPETKRKGITVVEISTDEESVDDMEGEPLQETSITNQKDKAPKLEEEEDAPPAEATTHSLQHNAPRIPSPIHTTTKVDIEELQDVEMAGAEDELQVEERAPQIHTEQNQEDPPKTPPRERTNDRLPSPDPTPASAPALIFPPLSKLPFTPIQKLSEAELDMTVEEWIRYQMEVEYDKFRRDGERELGRFKKRAEEVRGIIEAL